MNTKPSTNRKFKRMFANIPSIFVILTMAFPATWNVYAQESTFALAGTNIYVNTTEDEFNEDGDCSLREGTQAADTNSAVDACPAGDGVATDTINFIVSGTITLNVQLDIGAGGPLVINGGKAITLSGGGSGVRIFKVNSGAELTLDGLSITNGQADNGGGILNSGTLTILDSILSSNTAWGYSTGGGGIYNTGMLTIINSTLSSNSTFYHIGGGIYNLGELTISDSVLTGNSAYHDGGGIYNNTGSLTITNSNLSGNNANYYGGSVYNYSGTLSLTNSTLIGNTALYGGGIYNHQNGTATITNSTLSSNAGRAIYNQGPMTIASSTIAGNSGGIYGTGLGLWLRNTILANNGSDCYAPGAHSDGYNLIENKDGCDFVPTTGDLVGTSTDPINPRLGPLQDNGGLTFTYALYSNSPAQNAGNPAVPGSGGNACPATDQRGVARPVGSACDIGAYEGSIPAMTPDPLAPLGAIKDRTPTYIWSKITGATNYRYQLWKGTTLVYTKVVASSACSATTCSNTPITVLKYWGQYKWRAQAKVAGVWKSYSEYKNFTIVPNPKAGIWKGAALEFYVTPDRANVDNFAIYIHVNGCGNYKITYPPLLPINDGKFAFSDNFYVNGKFSNPTSAKGTMGLSSYYIPGCGYVSGGPFNWTAAWNNASQPTSVGTEETTSVIIMPALEAPSNSITVDSNDR